jgi:hypothetical protein
MLANLANSNSIFGPIVATSAYQSLSPPACSVANFSALASASFLALANAFASAFFASSMAFLAAFFSARAA